MLNTDGSFYGQQSGERILYVARPHPFSLAIYLSKFLIAAGLVFSASIAVAGQRYISQYGRELVTAGAASAGVILGAGGWLTNSIKRKNAAYLTDRRVVKFESATPFATNIRSLSWEEAVKVKTFPPNFIAKQLMIGMVVIHAKTTIAPADADRPENTVTDDDVEIRNVYFYRDLGNYIEKILFLYKKRPKEISGLKPFVPQKRGMRG